jgi:phytoene dehydrogenase-like protein
MLALDGGRLHALPGGFASLLTTSLLGVAEKLEAAGILQRLARTDIGALRGRSVAEWIDGVARRAGTRRLLHALVRVTCYANAPDLLAADAAVAQLARGLTGGVMYVDGGWQTIVSALAARAEAAGVAISTATRVARVESPPVPPSGSARGLPAGPPKGAGRVILADGSAVAAASVVIAAAPAAAAALVPSSAELAAAAAAAVPVRAACLDLALAELPRPRALFCLGIDEPLYYSVHSASAALAPEPTQVIHVARYLAPDETADASSLEALLDRLQPGWRERVVARRFLPRLIVANDLHPVGRRRPAAEPSDAPGVFAVGDWVGEGAMLADSVIASASATTAAILRQERPRVPAAEAQAWS